MGYGKLKGILKSKNIPVRECAKYAGVDITRLYNSMVISDYTRLTDQEKNAVYEFLMEHQLTKLSKEEVFSTDVDDRYEFDTFYKSSAVARSRRISSHKR